MNRPDPYLAFTRRFFRRWARFYDLFAIGSTAAYRAAARAARPAPGRRILDLCSGTGQIAGRVARRGARVVAVDASPAMLGRSRRRRATRTVPRVLADARRLPFRDAEFDGVTIGFALHDMPARARREVAGEARRVAGALVVTDYAPGGPPWDRLALRAIAPFESPWFPAFLREDVAALLAEAAWEVTTTRRPFGPFALWVARATPLPAGEGS